ncbi:peptidylprolyl isomerase [Scytonema hofmannii PCC 7110]|uniref:Peptidylprolyl isomerase n=1 Tax=Scytonema hofmannii PCC 7110 TaxID=128403 RepID=A0A139WYY2_9CYAN|nr:peptidylprolyl isomerase [Scytonema hofmannii]KYC37659.1 peptidylprolyl isomerase [Scytonema hofmannii PCC 7110]
MLNFLNISLKDIIFQLKVSYQIPGLVEAIAARKIIIDTAQKAGIKVDITSLQQAADSLRLANNLLKAEDTWMWLQKHHLTLEEFEQLAEINLLSANLASHLFADKVEPFFYEHQLDYLAAVTYEVVLDDEDVAWEVFYALIEGEMSFQECARQYIQNPELRRAGGYRGVRYRSNFPAEIAALVFAANPPQLLKPIVTSKGVHLLSVEEIIQPELNQQLRLKIMTDLFSTWLKEQIAELEIVTQLEPDSYSQTFPELLKLA